MPWLVKPYAVLWYSWDSSKNKFDKHDEYFDYLVDALDRYEKLDTSNKDIAWVRMYYMDNLWRCKDVVSSTVFKIPT